VSYQRRRGIKVKVYKTQEIQDQRGNRVLVPDMSTYSIHSVAQAPQRSARAEVPGQAEINVVRIIIDPNIKDVDLWSRIEMNGRMWDPVTPPAYHHGTRHTRHWSIDLRERP
jgi:hypothetical protein